MTTKEDMMFNDSDFEPYTLPSPLTGSPAKQATSSSARPFQPPPFQRSLSFTKDPNGPDSGGPGLMSRQRSFVRSNIANVRSSLRLRYPRPNPAAAASTDIMTQSVDQSVISRYY